MRFDAYLWTNIHSRVLGSTVNDRMSLECNKLPNQWPWVNTDQDSLQNIHNLKTRSMWRGQRTWKSNCHWGKARSNLIYRVNDLIIGCLQGYNWAFRHRCSRNYDSSFTRRHNGASTILLNNNDTNNNNNSSRLRSDRYQAVRLPWNYRDVQLTCNAFQIFTFIPQASWRSLLLRAQIYNTCDKLICSYSVSPAMPLA